MHKEGRKVMVESERLIRSVTELTSDSIYKVSKDELEIGSKLPYAGIQNFGGEIRVTPQMRAFLHWKGLHLKATTDKITIPARPFLFVSRTMEQMLNNSLVTYIQGYIRQLQRGD
jgi:phage gpG-like protein